MRVEQFYVKNQFVICDGEGAVLKEGNIYLFPSIKVTIKLKEVYYNGDYEY